MNKTWFYLSLITLSLLLYACGGGGDDTPDPATPDGLEPAGEYVGEVSVLGPISVTIEQQNAKTESYPAVARSSEGNVALECNFSETTETPYNFSCEGTDTVDSDGDGRDDAALPISFVGELSQDTWQGEFLSPDTSPLNFELQRRGDAPLKPSNVEAVPVEDYIDLTWTDNSDSETGFIIYRAQGNASFAEIGRTPPNVTTYRDEDVDIRQSYSYAVEAVGAGGTEPVEIDTPVSLRNRYNLNVAESEQGTILSSPAAIDCGANAGDCTADFAEGVKVTLRASASEGYVFETWQGACEGKGSCTLSMTEDKTLAAVFAPKAQERRLTVLFRGDGQGSAVSESSTVKCSSDCSQVFNRDSQLTLSAEPERGFFFQGWGGVCSGQALCQVNVNTNVLVTATFGRDDTPLPEPEEPTDGGEDTGADGDTTDGGTDNGGADDGGAGDTSADDTGADGAGEDTGADTDTGTDTDTGADGADDADSTDDTGEDTGAEDTGADDTAGDSGEDAPSDTDGADGGGEDSGDTTDGSADGGEDTAGADEGADEGTTGADDSGATDGGADDPTSDGGADETDGN